MTIPAADTPLYNHPLPSIERWLVKLGCQKNPDDIHCWYVERATWRAEVCLDIEEITVRYLNAARDGSDITRAFKYSLSRQDIESAIFSGP
ncbi:DUF3143 domain-containing protein [Pannus brasiliensis CCIBt3594]|uniref:DUF3143 domain-containing protein n=1 Tax=Pannus brasiliensis CCIBt3594 TaxID=1427578 RepID=A0AAW9QSU5_9CHRO